MRKRKSDKIGKGKRAEKPVYKKVWIEEYEYPADAPVTIINDTSKKYLKRKIVKYYSNMEELIAAVGGHKQR